LLRFAGKISLSAFLESLVAPTPTAVLAMLATIFLGATLMLLPAPLFYRLVDGIIPFDRAVTDGEPYLFGRLTRMFTTGRSDFRIAWIGGSTMRESLWSEAQLADEVAALTGRSVDVVDLSTGGQSLGLSLALAERSTCAAGAKIIVISVNVRRAERLALVDARPLMGYRSPATEAGGTSWRQKFGAGLRAAISLRGRIVGDAWGALERIVKGKGPRERHRYLDGSSLNPSEVEMVGNLELKQDLAAVAASMDRLESTVAACGGRVVYLLTPVNPMLLREERFPRFAAASAAIAEVVRQRAGPDVIDLNRLLHFEPEDFKDWGHLRSEAAIRQATSAAAAILATLIETSERK
jgi:hypothetical protein